MTLDKKAISKALDTITAPGEGKSLIESGSVKNIVTFDKEVIVDVTIGNPTLQAKKKVEVEIMKAIHDHVYEKAIVKVNITSNVKNNPHKPEKPKVPGIQNIIAIASGKGGVGKSSIATNLAAISASEGKKTLLIDLDAQCNSSQYLLGDELPEDEGTIAQYFSKSLRANFKTDIDDYIYDTEVDNLHAIPASPELGELQSRLEARHKIFKFRDLIHKLEEKYQHIYQVRYFSLSGQYQLHNTQSDERDSFVSLSALWRHLERNIQFEIPINQLENVDYLSIRLRLDTGALPSAMQLPVLLDSDWRFKSDWFESELIKPQTAQRP